MDISVDTIQSHTLKYVLQYIDDTLLKWFLKIYENDSVFYMWDNVNKCFKQMGYDSTD